MIVVNEIQDNSPVDKEMTTVKAAASLNPAEPTSAGVTGLQSADRIPWIGALAQPTPAVIAVVDSEGCLVPLQTAGDLLRAFRTIWRAAEP
jgi:hypothetical protein